MISHVNRVPMSCARKLEIWRRRTPLRMMFMSVEKECIAMVSLGKTVTDWYLFLVPTTGTTHCTVRIF